MIRTAGRTQSKEPDTLVGSFVFILHSHLPYVVTHGKWPHGSDWLNEAAAETYIPILESLQELLAEGFHPKLSVGITPVLAEQLVDPVFQDSFVAYLEEKAASAENDVLVFRKTGEERMTKTAEYWVEWYNRTKSVFVEKYDRDLVKQFRKLSDAGVLDILTSAATHGYLPLLSHDTTIRAQIKTGIETHAMHFGKRPRGIWLPECAYRPRYRWESPVDVAPPIPEYERKGIEEFLAEEDLEYFVIDSAMLMGGKPIGVYLERFEGLKKLWQQYEKQAEDRPADFQKSPLELYLVRSMGSQTDEPVAVFTRDPKTAMQIWSGEQGYPGDPMYLEFHKKYHLSGHRYWRVTDSRADLAMKKEYEPERAEERLEENATHFVELVQATLQNHLVTTGARGILTAPFDSELFGHWWFEGPRFLKKVLMKLEQSSTLLLTNAAEELDHRRPTKVIALPEGSWGEGGHHYIWLNPDTEWTWQHIYEDERRMNQLARQCADIHDEKLKAVLQQAARELLLLQASDWQFLISTLSARQYAQIRFANHHNDFSRLASTTEKFLATGKIEDEDWNHAEDCHERDSLFPAIDPLWWR